MTRAHSEYLTREARLASSSASAADAERYARLQQLESLFPTGTNGLGAAVNSMLNVWNDVASSPSDLSARVVALARADDLAGRMRSTVAQLDVLASSANQEASGRSPPSTAWPPMWPRSTRRSLKRKATTVRPTTCSTSAISC